MWTRLGTHTPLRNCMRFHISVLEFLYCRWTELMSIVGKAPECAASQILLFLTKLVSIKDILHLEIKCIFFLMRGLGFQGGEEWSRGLLGYAACSDTLAYQRFGGPCCPHLHCTWRQRQHGHPKHWYSTITLHNVTAQKNTTWINLDILIVFHWTYYSLKHVRNKSHGMLAIIQPRIFCLPPSYQKPKD